MFDGQSQDVAPSGSETGDTLTDKAEGNDMT